MFTRTSPNSSLSLDDCSLDRKSTTFGYVFFLKSFRINCVSATEIDFMFPIFFIVIYQILDLESNSRVKLAILALFEHTLKTLVKVVETDQINAWLWLFLNLFRTFLLILSLFCFLLAHFTTLVNLELRQSVQHIAKNFYVAIIEFLEQIFKTVSNQNASHKFKFK